MRGSILMGERWGLIGYLRLRRGVRSAPDKYCGGGPWRITRRRGRSFMGEGSALININTMCSILKDIEY